MESTTDQNMYLGQSGAFLMLSCLHLQLFLEKAVSLKIKVMLSTCGIYFILPLCYSLSFLKISGALVLNKICLLQLP
jgi:hypothetical protein